MSLEITSNIYAIFSVNQMAFLTQTGDPIAIFSFYSFFSDSVVSIDLDNTKYSLGFIGKTDKITKYIISPLQ